MRGPWNLWVWEGGWRVLASYTERREAGRALAAQDGCEPRAALARAGGAKDKAIRANCRDRLAPQRVKDR